MKNLKLNIIHLFPVVALSVVGCGGPSYKYDAASGLCKNKKGEVGFNEGKLMECGYITGSKYKGNGLDSSDIKNLKGLKVENYNFSNADFSNTDLTGSLWISKSGGYAILDNAKFNSANLSGAELDIHYKDLSKPRSFAGATINEHTIFPGKYFDYVGPNSEFDYGISLMEGTANLAFSNSDVISTPGTIFSNSMKSSHKALANSDFSRLKNGLYTTTGDAEILGGPSSENAFNFVNSRVGFWSSAYLYPGVIAFNVTTGMFIKTLIGDLKTDSDGVFKSLLFKDGPLLGFNPNPNVVDLSKNAVVSTAGLSPSFKMNGTSFVVDSHSDGGVGAFSNSYMNMEIPQIKRLSTLVHESRHSECKIPVSLATQYNNLISKLSALDMETKKIEEEFKKGALDAAKKDLQISKLSESSKALFEEIKNFALLVNDKKNSDGSKSFVMVDCGFDHIDCPIDHPDESIQGMEGACDDNPVGAYGVGYKFLMAVAEDCPSCKAVEREQARIKAGDSLGRYIGDEFPERIRKRNSGPHQMGFPKVNLNGI